jgi:hypothetical protein
LSIADWREEIVWPTFLNGGANIRNRICNDCRR